MSEEKLTEFEKRYKDQIEKFIKIKLPEDRKFSITNLEYYYEAIYASSFIRFKIDTRNEYGAQTYEYGWKMSALKREKLAVDGNVIEQIVSRINNIHNKRTEADMKEIKVLDHGHVRLVDSMGSDLSIVRNARVSYDAEWRAGEDKGGDSRLINYLYNNGHSTPFESVVFTFDVKAPIFVFRQWHRHRTQCAGPDTKLCFDLPGGKEGGSYRPYYLTIEDIYNKWHFGARPISTLKKPAYVENINPDQDYTISELSLLVDRREESLRNLCREGVLVHEKIKHLGPRESSVLIKGSDWIEWAEEKRNRMPMRKRLSEMKLRSYDESKKCIYHTKIVDVWMSGKKQLYEISVNGNKIKLSEDHPLLTESGWKKVKELEVGYDKLLVQLCTGEAVESFEIEIDENDEEWKFLPGTNEKYQISSQGRVKKEGVIRNLTNTSNGYKVTSINSNPNLVHRLVLQTFVGNCQKQHALHKNDNGFDNRLSNLKYGDDKENTKDRILNNGQTKLTTKFIKIDSIEKAEMEDTYDIEVEGPYHNFIAENFCTHNSYNELSARYKELPEEFYIPEAHLIGKQNKDNKQMRDPLTVEEYNNLDMCDKIIIENCLKQMKANNEDAFQIYREFIKSGIPRELARTVLPFATYSHMFATVNLHNLFKFLDERLHEHAQYEIRVFAQAILELIEPIAPVAVGCFKKRLEKQTDYYKAKQVLKKTIEKYHFYFSKADHGSRISKLPAIFAKAYADGMIDQYGGLKLTQIEMVKLMIFFNNDMKDVFTIEEAKQILRYKG